MKLITKNTDYALRALSFLAGKDDKFISSRIISQQEKIPLQFLRRILRKLNEADIIIAREGIDGGVKLKARPEDIYFSEVMRIFQGNIQLADCMFRKRICYKRSACVLRKKIRQIEERLAGEFNKITIESLM